MKGVDINIEKWKELFPDVPVEHRCPECNHVYYRAHKRGMHVGLCVHMKGILSEVLVDVK